MKIFLIRVVLKGLFLGICIPAVNYVQDQKGHPEASTYNFWEGFLEWTLIGIVISFVGWQVEKYYLRKHGEKVPE